MTLDHLLDELAGSTPSFEAALGQAPQFPPSDLLVEFLKRLDREEFPDPSERERRFASLLDKVSPAAPDLLRVAEEAAKINSSLLKNAVAQLLPPECRRLIFRPADGSALKNISLQLADRLALTISAAGRASAPRVQPALFSDVIVLSLEDDAATQKLLENADFVRLRYRTVEELNAALSTNASENVCAFLVESSFLESLDSPGQRQLIERLARFSTFVWLRLQERGLTEDNPTIRQLIKRTRCQTGEALVSFQESAGLRERELPDIRAAHDSLVKGAADSLFTPGELSPAELRLLAAAMGRYSEERNFDPRTELTRVTTRFLHGGNTGARVALVKVNDFRVPIIVKIDAKQSILDEAGRFMTFIHRNDAELRPEIHFHSDAALIIFGIIPDPNAETDRAAPTLDDRLREYWYSEMWNGTDPGGADRLLRAFIDASRRLAAMNKQKCTCKSFPCRANPFVKSVKTMEERGFNWGFGSEVLASRAQAEELLAAASEMAVCHGDAHTRNILIRGEQGFPIDYAFSGPGHPCSDLVKLELGVYLSAFTLLGPAHELEALQRELSIDRLPEKELAERHRKMLGSKTSRLCLSMCVAARDLAAEVLAAHQLDPSHYVALKILTAWQTLQIPTLQQALARGVISALAPSTISD